MRKNEKGLLNDYGFSLLELIIVIAIMAVLIGILMPGYLKYVEKSKRTADVHNAREIRDAFERIAITLDPGTGGGGLPASSAIMWNKDSTMHEPPRNIAEYVFDELGRVPISETNEDYFWVVNFDPATGSVRKIYLTDRPGGTLSLELYPDYTEFLTGN